MNQRTRIKICGLTREADVDAAVEAGADAIGFVLYEKSSRHVTLQRATELARRLPVFVMPVGLFVNASDAALDAAVQAIPQLLLQFHGDESPEACRRPTRPYMRAARMAVGFDLLTSPLDFQTPRRFCSTPMSTATVAVERFSIGPSFRTTCPFQSFCLVGCMQEM